MKSGTLHIFSNCELEGNTIHISTNNVYSNVSTGYTPPAKIEINSNTIVRISFLIFHFGFGYFIRYK